ncbi:MAG TPA: YceI family protein [Gemmatimonadales bacterium]|nr:YceI family protein [Gemmatimonadales bacterium]
MWRALSRVGGAAMLMAAVPVDGATAQPVVTAPFSAGQATFTLHSTLVGHFVGRAPIASAEFSGGRLTEVRGTAVVLVADMRTGNGLRDSHMREAMRADSFPTIRFDLDSVASGAVSGDTTGVVLVGRLAVHGVTRPLRATATAVARPGGEDVDASFGLDMRDFGIRPPVRALVLHVAPDVVVTVHLSFGGSPPT